MSSRDKQMNFMAALKAASLIMEGTKMSREKLCEYTEEVLEHFYEFEWNQKASFVQAEETINQEVDAAVQEKRRNLPF
jgi:predicted DNA-binding ArsR family transcriptional regulator